MSGPEVPQEAVDALARLMAKRRTGGAVFMGGEHNPLPSEIRDAEMFVGDFIDPHVIPPGDTETIHADLSAILRALGLGDHARPISMHRIVWDEVLPAIYRLHGIRGEVDRLRYEVERAIDAEVERDAARAQVAAVRALCDEAETWATGRLRSDVGVRVDNLRAALDTGSTT